MLVADGLMILTFLLMLAGLVWGLRLGYVSLDVRLWPGDQDIAATSSLIA